MEFRLPSPKTLFSSVLIGCSVALPLLAKPLNGIIPADLQFQIVDWHLGVAGGIAAMLANVYVLDEHLPFSRERQQSYFDKTFVPILDALKHVDPTIRINIMVRRLGGLRLEFFRKFGFPMLARDRTIGLWSHQGAAGLAVEHKHWILADVSSGKAYVGKLGGVASLADPRKTLSEKQRRSTSDLTLIYSMPIFRLVLNKNTRELELSDKVIGVINIDSSLPNALALHHSNSVSKKIVEELLPDATIQAAYMLS